MQGKALVIREAILSRRPLLAQHRGRWLTLCPHLLARRGDARFVVAYVCGRRPRWVCLAVTELTYVRNLDAPWESGLLPRPPLDDDMEVEMAVVVVPAGASRIGALSRTQ